tara:strand:- start:1093 stop:1452 length:360 start_codon:yes stop_codon:yes gene_type:complete
MEKLLKRRITLKHRIEHDMYENCGPDINDCNELDITDALIKDKENDIIIEYYRTAIGELKLDVDRSMVDSLEMYDFNNVLKNILDENDIKWHDHKLYKEHMKKTEDGYFKKEANNEINT